MFESVYLFVYLFVQGAFVCTRCFSRKGIEEKARIFHLRRQCCKGGHGWTAFNTACPATISQAQTTIQTIGRI